MARALHNLFEFLDKFKLQRCKTLLDVKKGDVVVCFEDDDTDTIKSLGTVQHTGKTKLAADHVDGDFGDVFILPFNKVRTRNTPFNGKYIGIPTITHNNIAITHNNILP